jgi:putative ABC transport system substrate-binding protein
MTLVEPREHMQRREFITIVGGAAIWPLTACAQQSGKMRCVGMPMGESESQFAIFARRLNEFGWKEGRDLRIETRWWDGHRCQWGAKQPLRRGMLIARAYRTSQI